MTPSVTPVIGGVGSPSAPPPAVSGVSHAALLSRTEIYVPPTSKLPDAPEVPGKWQPQYTRDYKSYVVPGLDGIRSSDTVSRATSHAKVLGDDSNLTDWLLSATVLGLARNPEMLEDLHVDGAMHLSDLDFRAKQELKRIGRQAARRVGADDGSDFGTKLHGYLEAIIEGACTIDDVPEPLRPYIVVAFEAMRRHGLNFVGGMSERTVFIPDTNSVGTLDFMVVDENGVLMIGDLKTSNTIQFSWLSIGVQLAQYASSTLILSRDGSHWEPMPEVSRVVGKVLSVPKDVPTHTAQIYTVNLELGMEMVQYASRVRAIQEAARRAAATPEKYGADDELMAWADGDPVTLTGPTGAVA